MAIDSSRERERELVFLKGVATDRLAPLLRRAHIQKYMGNTNLMSYRINNE